MTFDRETRRVFIVILAIVAILIGVNLFVNPSGLPAWAGFAALIAAIGAVGLWVLSWRESIAAETESEPEPIVTFAPPPAPVLPVSTPAPVAQSAPEPVVVAPEPEPEPVVAEVTPEPEPEPVVEEIVPEPVVVEAAPEPEPAPVVVETAPEPEPEPVVAEVAPEPVAEVVAAAPEVAPAETAHDDFTKIEGIGPYYQNALNKLGIYTYAQLSTQTADGLVTQLKANGFRQHPAIPTWAEQAALAAAGDWAGLEALQAKLDGGRRTEG